jgi:hypothetical protein
MSPAATGGSPVEEAAPEPADAAPSDRDGIGVLDLEIQDISFLSSTEQDAAALSHALLASYLGDVATASAELARLEADRRPDWGAVQMTTWYLRTRSAARLVDGDPAGALADARESIALEESGGNASTALWQGVQAAVRLSDPAAIVGLVSSTNGLRGAWVDSVRQTATAAVTILEGHVDAGSAQMAAALGGWRDLDLPLDHALASAAAGHLLPPERWPVDDIESARGYLQGLLAEGLLRLFVEH